eukprot:5239718-Pyramimonas_sp.AAC.1
MPGRKWGTGHRVRKRGRNRSKIETGRKSFEPARSTCLLTRASPRFSVGSWSFWRRSKAGWRKRRPSGTSRIWWWRSASARRGSSSSRRTRRAARSATACARYKQQHAPPPNQSETGMCPLG